MAKLSDIEGIGPAFAEKLSKAGITSIDKLLQEGCSKKGRQKIAEESGIKEKTILNWVNRADLSRIKGVSTQYADLLKFAGVDTVPELAQRNGDNLHKNITEVNEEKKLVRKLPTVAQVQDWIAQAKKLPKVVTH